MALAVVGTKLRELEAKLVNVVHSAAGPRGDTSVGGALSHERLTLARRVCAIARRLIADAARSDTRSRCRSF